MGLNNLSSSLSLSNLSCCSLIVLSRLSRFVYTIPPLFCFCSAQGGTRDRVDPEEVFVLPSLKLGSFSLLVDRPFSFNCLVLSIPSGRGGW